MLSGFLGGLSNLGQVYSGFQNQQQQDILNRLRQQQVSDEQQRQQALTALGKGFQQLPNAPPLTMAGRGGSPPPLDLPQVPPATATMEAGGGGLPPANLGDIGTGKGSVFGNYAGYRDASDSGMTASGVPTSTPGIALRIPRTSPDFGKTYDVTTPEGRTFTAPQTDYGPAARTGRSVDISAGLAEQMYPGGTAGSFPTDKQFIVKAHQRLDTDLDQTSNAMIRNGQVSGPVAQDSTKTAMEAGRGIDIRQWGRATLKEAIDAVEKANPEAPPAVKALAVMQLHKLLAPEDKLLAQQLMKENEHSFRLELETLKGGIRGDIETLKGDIRKEIVDVQQKGANERNAARLVERQREFDQRELRLGASGSGKLTPEESAQLRRLKAQQVAMNNQAARYGGWIAAPDELRVQRDAVDEQIDDLLKSVEKRVGGTPVAPYRPKDVTPPGSTTPRPGVGPQEGDQPSATAPVP